MRSVSRAAFVQREAVTALLPRRPLEPFGIIAGGGRLPHILADAVSALGWFPVLALVGDADPLEWDQRTARTFRWGETGDVVPYLRKHSVRHVAFCGTVTKRPDYRAILPTLRTLAMLPEIFGIMTGGDDRLLRAVSTSFERRGFQLHAVHEMAPEILMPAGPITRRTPDELETAALKLGSDAAERLGALDVGQAAVASQDRVIALEGIEGTREMLVRVGDLRARGRIAKSERCVLVKTVKPQQDRRFDLPSIGLQTVTEAKTAGLVGIGLSAGASLVLGREDVVTAADEAGLFLTGLGAGGGS